MYYLTMPPPNPRRELHRKLILACITITLLPLVANALHTVYEAHRDTKRGMECQEIARSTGYTTEYRQESGQCVVTDIPLSTVLAFRGLEVK